MTDAVQPLRRDELSQRVGVRMILESDANALAEKWITAMAKLLGLGDAMTAKEVYDLVMAGHPKVHTIFGPSLTPRFRRINQPSVPHPNPE